MHKKRSTLFTLIFFLALASTAPAQGVNQSYARWIMAGIGSVAATVFAYPWLKAAYWGYTITKELPHDPKEAALTWQQKLEYVKIIKALPELHNSDGVKTFVWGHRIKKSMPNLEGSNQVKYLKLLHELHKENEKLRKKDSSIPDLRDPGQDYFILWIYKLQKEINVLNNATQSKPMSLQEQVNAVMLLHKNELQFLHTDAGIKTILFTLQVQQVLHQQAARIGQQTESMPDKDKIYYLTFMHKLLKQVSTIVSSEKEQAAWVKTLVWAKKLQAAINSNANNDSGMSLEQKIAYVIQLHQTPELHDDEGIQTVLDLYSAQRILPEIRHRWNQLWSPVGSDPIHLDF